MSSENISKKPKSKKTSQNRVKELEKKVKQLEHSDRYHMQQHAKVRDENDKLIDFLEKITRSSEKRNEEIESLKGKVDGLTTDIREYKKQNEEIENLERQIANLTTNIKKYKEQETGAFSEWAQRASKLETTNKKSIARIVDLEYEIFQLKEEIEKLQQNFYNLQQLVMQPQLIYWPLYPHPNDHPWPIEQQDYYCRNGYQSEESVANYRDDNSRESDYSTETSSNQNNGSPNFFHHRNSGSLMSEDSIANSDLASDHKDNQGEELSPQKKD